MVGHHNCGVKIEFLHVAIDATVQYNISRWRREDTTLVRHKGNEMRPVVALIVRQVSTVEFHA